MSKPTHQIVVAKEPEKPNTVRVAKMVKGTPQFINEIIRTPKIYKNEDIESIEKIKYVSKNISQRIKDARMRLNQTQIDFAIKAGINVNVLKSYENGTAIPNSVELQKLSSAAGENLKKPKK